MSQLHPAVLELGREYASGTIRGGNARCRAMLQTFGDILLEDYVPPPPTTSGGVTDYRTHLDQTVLKPSFTYWTTQCRPHSVSMGNAFTFLKSAVASLDRDLPYHHVPTTTTTTTTTGATTNTKENVDDTTAKDNTNDDDDDDDEVPCAKRLLQESIQQFIQERLDYADQAIAQHAFTKIERGDVLMTFGYSEIISVLIDTAARELRGDGGISGGGKATPLTSSSFATSSSSSSSSSSSCSPFFVWVVDAPPLWEGRQLIQQLQFWNIPCGYITLNALGLVMDQNQQTKNKQVTKVFLGASALLTNGSVFGRAGTACVALLAQDYHIPVLVCCETYKISNRVPLLESITHNELGNPESLLVAPSPQGGGGGGESSSSSSTAADASSLSNWKTVPHLKLLHLLYDVTPSDFISAIITEVGIIPPTSVAVLLREMNPQDSAVE
jgi:translation initiation factor eIF-2B subunit delta